MVRRASRASFMAGARVFPGGAIDDADSGLEARTALRWSGDPEETAWRAAALRELAEETGIVVAEDGVRSGEVSGDDLYRTCVAAGRRLDADALHYLSNWVTPRGLPKRFDTRFYLVEVGADVAARADRVEVFDPVWVTPAAALAAAADGSWVVEFPTRIHLELLAATGGIEAALASGGTPERIEPRLVAGVDGAWSILLPGQPGYDS